MYGFLILLELKNRKFGSFNEKFTKNKFIVQKSVQLVRIVKIKSSIIYSPNKGINFEI
jgi:hypothetical protein